MTIEAIGLARLQEIYREAGNHHGIEEIRFDKMRNHLWLRGMRKHASNMMRPLASYFVFSGTSFFASFILIFWLIGLGLSGLFYYLLKRKGIEEYSIPLSEKRPVLSWA